MDLMEKYLSRVKIEDREIELKGKKIAANVETQRVQLKEIEETTYTFDEVSKLIDAGVSSEGLEAIHKIKKIFPEATVKNIENK